ncbi:S9 family peptidase [Thermococcus barophilus]|uniref:Acylamino-acid-releasing enzyme n=1 Tax=Thermococcus barophilus (strain DSM 11836 / MP) TaxID=391623 RepID=F0LJT0_THEBM|nr:S9 family peptidase [Thermococcus barophilus]ADT84722.1 acylamino-acid-releasing enzyme [Thermococcus barophilus MP]
MKKLDIRDLGKFKLVGGLDIHKNKTAFTVTEVNLEKDDYFSKIYLYDGRKVMQFTSGPKDSNPKFSPDGNFMAFTSKRNKESKESELYLIPTRGGEAKLLTRFKYGINDFEFSPDGKALAVISPVEVDRKKEKDDVHIIKEIPFWFNGIGWIYGKRAQIFLVNTESGRKRKLTKGKLNILTLKWSDDGSKIYFIAQEDRERKPMISDLYVLDVKSKKIEKLTDSKWRIGDFVIIDEKHFVLRMSTLERGIPTNTHIYLFNAETKEIKKLTEKLDRSAYNSLNCDVRGKSRNPLIYKDGWVYYIATDGPRANLFRVDLEGNIERVIAGDRSIETFGIGNYIAFIAQDAVTPTELYILRDGKEKRVTNFNEWIKEYKLSKPEHFKVKASDGVEIDAWIMRPVDFKEGKKYPTILEIHGGPKTAYGYSFMHEFHVLTSKGFVVIFSNPRGSDGYGEDFADIRKHYGERDYQDLMEVVDEALKRFDFIDPERIGVTGGSYGGFMTNWIVGHTNRFKAAVTQRSISNWMSFFGTTDIGYYFAPDQIGEDPWSNFEGYWEKSPLKYAPNVETPLLIIHSMEDYRCWLPEALQLFTALKYFGKTVELAVFPGENHDLSRSGKPKHRVKRLELIVGWFERWLK